MHGGMCERWGGYTYLCALHTHPGGLISGSFSEKDSVRSLASLKAQDSGHWGFSWACPSGSQEAPRGREGGKV